MLSTAQDSGLECVWNALTAYVDRVRRRHWLYDVTFELNVV